MAHKKWTTQQEKFRKTAVELAKEALEHAIEWIDHNETGWATVEACKAPIEWWATPNGKKIPMDHGTANPHWASCPNAADFRREKTGRSAHETLSE